MPEIRNRSNEKCPQQFWRLKFRLALSTKFLGNFSYLRYNLFMSEKNKLARKSYWASIPPEERSRRMREIAIKRQKGLSFKQKREHALKMRAARGKAKVVV